MPKCKITVLRKDFDQELADEYCQPGQSPNHVLIQGLYKDDETGLLSLAYHFPFFCDIGRRINGHFGNDVKEAVDRLQIGGLFGRSFQRITGCNVF